MQYHRAYYSIIQYCPDRGRAEAANIGVLLLCPELQFVDARMSTTRERVRKFFGSKSFDTKRFHLIERSIEEQVREKYDWSQGLADLERFIGTRANDIQLTPARPMKTANPQADLVQLFAELVEAPRAAADNASDAKASLMALSPVFRRFDARLKEPGIRERIRFDEVIEVPVLGTQLEVPYAYRNGALNLVKPHEFAGSARRATADAKELAIEGDLLRRHPEVSQPRQLIVLPAFSDETRGASRRVETLLSDFGVRVVAEEEIDEFATEIAKNAH